jgi:hypothetical protein
MQKSIQAATQTKITVIRLERNKEKEKNSLFMFKCAKSECLNLKRQDLWTPSLVSVWSFVHLQQTKLECAVGVNVAPWCSDRRRGQSAGQGCSRLSHTGMVGIISTTGRRISVKKRI